jgi:putative transposase
MPITGNIYHLLNRGIDSRLIFQEKRDYERFLLTILECNSNETTEKNRYRRVASTKDNIESLKKSPLVAILCLCLMPNHFHLVAKQLVEGGIVRFMQRLGNSYTKYFNIKHERKGRLFMARYKSVAVESDSQLKHLVTYVHANPLDLGMPEWRRGGLGNFSKAKRFLEDYQWSSYPFYAKCNYPFLIGEIVTGDDELLKYFYPTSEDYFNAIGSWSNRRFEDFSDFE